MKSVTPPAHIFREYDIRGVAARDLEDDVVMAIGQGLGTMLAKEAGKAIVVGRDCRLSSPRLAAALKAGLVRAGARVIDIGVVATPILYFGVHHFDAAGGVMITGSHNPPEDNGFKCMIGKASFFGEKIQELKRRIETGDLAEREGGKEEEAEIVDAYIDRITSDIDLRGKEPHVIVDAGNGAAGPFILKALAKLGVQVDAIHCEMDGTFPNHHPDPTVVENLEELIDRVKSQKADVGIAFDGDGDRIGAVDTYGDIIWGDRLMILFSRALLEKHPGAAILGEVKCSQTLYDDIAKHGGKPILWKTGHSLIKAKMKETGAKLAGEMSGHLFFADRYFGYDDAIYAALRLLEIVATAKGTLTDELADVPQTFVTPEIRVDCADATKFEVVRRVQEHYKSAGRDVIDIDGARIQFGTPEAPAWGLVRASNTGPVLVMRFEATSAEERDRIRAEVEAVVRDAEKAASTPAS